MEALSDGVIAIIVTIMVLELHAPERATFAALSAVAPTFMAYVLSFALVAIYWVNHHHLLHDARRVGQHTLWLNIHFLFWLSLFPFATAYIGETRGSSLATALYAVLSLLVATAFLLFTRSLARHNPDAELTQNLSRRLQIKNLVSMAAMLAAVPLAFVYAPAAIALLTLPALAYFFPDR